MTDFTGIAHLAEGNARQRRVHDLFVRHRIMERLAGFTPVLVGTVPIGIDLSESDLDILCRCSDPEAFMIHARKEFGHEEGFTARIEQHNGRPTVVANFSVDGEAIELFAQDVPVTQQAGFIHLLVEHRILQERGPEFRAAVVELKRQGLKTEPAFALLVGLPGDPYEALLALA